MSSSEHDGTGEERFERLLLDSAQNDELPSNVDAAWQQFSSALNGVSLLAAGTGGALAVRRAQRWLLAKWLLGGALAGSALTALSLRPSHELPTLPIAAPSAAMAGPVVASSAPPPRIELEATTRTKATAKPAPHFIRPHTPRTPPARSEAAPRPSSTLSVQVALLDAARGAIASGALAEALRLAERYRADFPNGELAPEAEVVAIEALVEQGERQPALERAARFLARYPGDPHSARVKWLVR